MTDLQQHTIDVGIDLGTTNSSITVLVDGKPVVLSGMNSITTPSVVRIRANGALDVGLHAYQQLEFNPQDVKSEFKTAMGTRQEYSFTSSGRRMTAPQLSAEVLKVLLGYVQQQFGFSPSAAVITVPAAFDLAQCAATQTAAELAGLRQAPLLQEPVAAALAYGYSTERLDGTWLVYDLGGGTFDLALVGVRAGQITVLDHEGDNHLGGKDIDWLIVERILVPRLAERWQVESFRQADGGRGRERAMLKAAAETAKIALSASDSATVTLESDRGLLADDAGQEIAIDISVSREDLESITRPLIDRTIELCRRLFARNAGTTPSEVMLVGGPTLMPLVRQQLQSQLGLALNTRAHPLTAVAEGAALYAGTQSLDVIARGEPTSHDLSGTQHAISFQHVAVTEDDETALGCRVSAPDASVLMVSSSGWESGQIPLINGACVTRVPLLNRGKNEFSVRVLNMFGADLPISPRSFSVHRGLTAAAAPISHSVGVVIEEGFGSRIVEWLIKKGTALPVERRVPFRTTRALDPDGEPDVISIHLVEGESRRPDRNRQVGRIEISSSVVPRLIPAGSPVEVRIQISQSRTVRAQVHIPSTDQFFNIETQMTSEETTPSELTVELLHERQRLEEALPLLDTGDVVALRQRIEQVASEVSSVSSGDAGTAQKALNSLKALQSQLDDIDQRSDFPRAVSEARGELAAASPVVLANGSESQERRLQVHASEINRAAESGDISRVEQVEREIVRLRFEVLSSQPWFWKEWFEYLCAAPIAWSDPGTAQVLMQEGSRAIEHGNTADLSRVTFKLNALAPNNEGSFGNVGIRRS